MRIDHEEPTGVWVCIAEGEPFVLTFPEFVRGIESSEIGGNALIWSRIVTGGAWVRAEEMRVFQIVRAERRAAEEADLSIWPPPPQR